MQLRPGAGTDRSRKHSGQLNAYPCIVRAFNAAGVGDIVSTLGRYCANSACNKQRYLWCMCVCVYIHVLLRSRATNAYSELWVNEVYDTFRCTRSSCGFESLREIERMVSIEMRNILLFISCLFFIRLSRRILSSPFKRVHREIIQIYNFAAIFCLFGIKR